MCPQTRHGTDRGEHACPRSHRDTDKAHGAASTFEELVANLLELEFSEFLRKDPSMASAVRLWGYYFFLSLEIKENFKARLGTGQCFICEEETRHAEFACIPC